VQHAFASERSPTVGRTLPILECLIECWSTFAQLKKFAKVKHALEIGIAKLCKWYKSTDNTDMYFIALGM